MNDNIQRGDIWWVSLDPTQGSEIKKTRPCLVLTNDILNQWRNTVVVVPLSTSARSHPPITVSMTCQGKSVVAIIDQIRAVDKRRLKRKIEKASDHSLKIISQAITNILEII